MRKKKPIGGYKGLRDPITGLTPREELYRAQKMLCMLQIAKEKGELISRQDAEAAAVEAAEVIKSDLYGTLPDELVSLISTWEKIPEPQIVRTQIRSIIDQVVRGWRKAGLVKNAE